MLSVTVSKKTNQHVSNAKWPPTYLELLESRNTTASWNATEKERLLTVNFFFILISYSNDKFSKVHRILSKILLSNSMDFATLCKNGVFLVWVPLWIFLCWQQHPKYEWAIRLLYPNFFFKIRSSPNPTNNHLTHERFVKEGHCVPDSYISLSLTLQNQSGVHINHFSPNGPYYYLPKC